MKLGSAFQKVNFLRDFKQDYDTLNRAYFPNIDPNTLSNDEKDGIINDIKEEFQLAYQGIKILPKEAKLGVYIAYKYYLKLLNKIDKTPPNILKEKRIRVPDTTKTYIFLKSYMRYHFNII